jgi:hypothetical protein
MGLWMFHNHSGLCDAATSRWLALKIFFGRNGTSNFIPFLKNGQ